MNPSSILSSITSILSLTRPAACSARSLALSLTTSETRTPGFSSG